MTAKGEDLLIQPFKDVVAGATAALANVSELGTDAAMYKAAHALVREGERALRKVQQVWDELVAQHGDNFKSMMVQQASIEKRRLDLERLLWDFEDFLHPDEFDPARFAQLQAATKSLALDITETAKRLKLSNTIIPPQTPQAGFPPLPPLPSRPPTRSSYASRPPSAHSTRPRTLSRAGALRRGSEQHETAASASIETPARDVPEAQAPYSREEIIKLARSLPYAAAEVPRRSISATPADGADNKVSPRKVKRPAQSQPVAAFAPPDLPFKDAMSSPALTPPASPGTSPVLVRGRNLTLHTPVSHPIEDLDDALSLSPANATTSATSHNTRSIAWSNEPIESLDSLVLTDEPPEPHPANATVHSPPPGPTRDATNRLEQHQDTPVGIGDAPKNSEVPGDRRQSRPPNPRLPDCAIREDSTYHKMRGLCRGAVRFRTDGHWGSIKVDTEADYAGGGAASGGGDFLRASNGIVIPLDYETTKLGSCGDCGYAHDLDEVEADKSDSAEAIRTSPSGARYRLRLLFKSHLRQTTSRAEAFYACLWCVKAGATVREDDATVFRSPNDLLDHLARHPQPLPPLPGVAVRYGNPPSPSPDPNPHPNPSSDPVLFDLHLPNPPLPAPLPDSVARLPTATAIKPHFRRPGRAKLDRPPTKFLDSSYSTSSSSSSSSSMSSSMPSPAGGDGRGRDVQLLEFMEGARIVGVVFPEPWGGKWCLGRHDGRFGAFPAKAVELRPPPSPAGGEVPLVAGGEGPGVSAVARWKFAPPSTSTTAAAAAAGRRGHGTRAGGECRWLAFGKGEVITNVQCLYADYWCWSGTNSKGETGVFPQSHIDLQTLGETEPKKPSKGRGLFGYRPGRNREAASSDKAGYRSSTGS